MFIEWITINNEFGHGENSSQWPQTAVDYRQILLIPLFGKYRIFRLWKIKQSVSCSVFKFIFIWNKLPCLLRLSSSSNCWVCLHMLRDNKTWGTNFLFSPHFFSSFPTEWGFLCNFSKMWECFPRAAPRINHSWEKVTGDFDENPQGPTRY